MIYALLLLTLGQSSVEHAPPLKHDPGNLAVNATVTRLGTPQQTYIGVIGRRDDGSYGFVNEVPGSNYLYQFEPGFGCYYTHPSNQKEAEKFAHANAALPRWEAERIMQRVLEQRCPGPGPCPAPQPEPYQPAPQPQPYRPAMPTMQPWYMQPSYLLAGGAVLLGLVLLLRKD
jgi:hypothetical protein